MPKTNTAYTSFYACFNRFVEVCWGSEFSFFWGIPVRIYIKIDISISTRSMATKFGKQVALEELTQMRPMKRVLVMPSRQNVTN